MAINRSQSKSWIVTSPTQPTPENAVLWVHQGKVKYWDGDEWISAGTDSLSGGTDPTTDPTTEVPKLLAEYHDTLPGIVIDLNPGVNRKLVVGITFESSSAAATGCLFNGSPATSSRSLNQGINFAQCYVYDLADVASGSMSISPVFTVEPADGDDVQIHVYLVANVVGSASFTTAQIAVATTLNPNITTDAAGEVVCSFIGSGAVVSLTSPYGSAAVPILDSSSGSNALINLATGSAGAQTITWAASGATRMASVTVRFGAVTPAPPPPQPDTGSGATTIWNTKVAVGATLQPSGLTAVVTHLNGTTRTCTAQIDSKFFHQVNPSKPLTDVWECQQRPTFSNPPRKNRKIGTLRLSDTFTFQSGTSNDLSTYYDDATGSVSGTPGKILFGGGTTHRPSVGSPYYHNYEVPPPGNAAHGDQGTFATPGRGGACGAARVSAAGLTIMQSEYNAAVGGNVSAINHALALLLYGFPFLSRSSSGFRWPAYSTDGAYDSPTAENYHNGSLEYMRMGALLALPARLTKDSTSIPLSLRNRLNPTDTSNFAKLLRALAETLFLFGGYVTDNTAWNAYTLTVDGAVGKAFMSTKTDRYALRDLMIACSCVTSNGPTTIGGAAAGAARRT